MTEADDSNKLVPKEEHTAHIDVSFKFEYVTLEYTPTDQSQGMEDLFPSSYKRREIGCAADAIACVRRVASKRLVQELLAFIHMSIFKANEYKTYVQSLPRCQSIC